MRRYHAPSTPLGAFYAGQSWADCITNTAGSDFRQGQVLRQQINVLRRTVPKRLLISSIDIRRPFSAVPRCSGRAGDRQAGHRDPLAPGRVQSLLALEIENPRGAAKGAAGSPLARNLCVPKT